MNRFEEIIDDTLALEGGFVNDPDDPGGATKFGITLDFYRSQAGESVGVEDIKDLTRAEAKDLYRDAFWSDPQKNVDGYGYDCLPRGVDRLVFSFAVNMGSPRAHTLLQKAIVAVGGDVKVDGWYGPETILEAIQADTDALQRRLAAKALEFYTSLVRQDPNKEKFLGGWFYRVTTELQHSSRDTYKC